MRFLLFTASCVLFATAAFALPNGEYSGEGDGFKVRLTVDGTDATMSTYSTMCVGGGDGSIAKVADTTWHVTLRMDGSPDTCTVQIDDTADGLYSQEVRGCDSFAGAMCNFEAWLD